MNQNESGQAVSLVCRISAAVLAVFLFPSAADATAIAIILSRHRIVVAADGLATNRENGVQSTEEACKIGQTGPHSFFTLAGLRIQERPFHFSPWDVANDSFNYSDDPAIAANAFVRVASAPWFSIARYAIDHRPPGAQPSVELLQVFFVGVRDGALTVVEVFMAMDLDHAVTNLTYVYSATDLGNQERRYFLAGYEEAMRLFIDNHTDWIDGGEASGAKNAVNAVVDNKAVGPPLAVLNIPDFVGPSPRWEEQGACPAIAPE
jgi:hypothetical protein